MKKYEVTIEEILRKTIFVEAENEADAYDMAEEIYHNEDVVLMPEDLAETSFYVEGVVE